MPTAARSLSARKQTRGMDSESTISGQLTIIVESIRISALESKMLPAESVADSSPKFANNRIHSHFLSAAASSELTRDRLAHFDRRSKHRFASVTSDSQRSRDGAALCISIQCAVPPRSLTSTSVSVHSECYRPEGSYDQPDTDFNLLINSPLACHAFHAATALPL